MRRNIKYPTPALPEFTVVKSLCDHFSKSFVDKNETSCSKFADKVQNNPPVQKADGKPKMKVFEYAT